MVVSDESTSKAARNGSQWIFSTIEKFKLVGFTRETLGLPFLKRSEYPIYPSQSPFLYDYHIFMYLFTLASGNA